MSFKKFVTAVLLCALTLSLAVSCAQPSADALPDFVDEVQVVNADVDGNQKYMAYEMEFVSDKEYENPVYTVNMDVVFRNEETGTELKVPPTATEPSRE